jgi:hypothetical protein
MFRHIWLAHHLARQHAPNAHLVCRARVDHRLDGPLDWASVGAVVAQGHVASAVPKFLYRGRHGGVPSAYRCMVDDQFAIGPSGAMDGFASVYPDWHDLLRFLPVWRNDANGHMNERILTAHLRYRGVQNDDFAVEGLSIHNGEEAEGAQRKRRLAIGFFGLSHLPDYTRSKNGKVEGDIDYRSSIGNYKHFLFPLFDDWEITVFLCTNPSEHQAQVLEDFKPAAAEFTTEGRQGKFKAILGLIANYSALKSTAFDGVLLTRFDMLFQNSLGDAAIDWSTLNLVSTLETPEVVDDNLYIFPGSMLPTLQRQSVEHNANKSKGLACCPKLMACCDSADYANGHVLHHFLPGIDINYLRDEAGTKIDELSFYKIARWVEARPGFVGGKFFNSAYCSD